MRQKTETKRSKALRSPACKKMQDDKSNFLPFSFEKEMSGTLFGKVKKV